MLGRHLQAGRQARPHWAHYAARTLVPMTSSPTPRPWPLPQWRQPTLLLALPAAALVLLCAMLGQGLSERAGMDQLAAVANERLELYAASLEAELARHAYLPGLLSVDADVQRLLAEPLNEQVRARARLMLAGVRVRSGLSLAFISDAQGQVLASSNNYARQDPDPTLAHTSAKDMPRQEAAPDAEARRLAQGLGARLLQGPSQFFAAHEDKTSSDYFLVQPLQRGGQRWGQIVLKLNLAPLEATWVDQGLRSQGEKLLVVDGQGVVIMSSVPSWKYHLLGPSTAEQRAALRASGQYAGTLEASLGLDMDALSQQQNALVQLPSWDPASPRAPPPPLGPGAGRRASGFAPGDTVRPRGSLASGPLCRLGRRGAGCGAQPAGALPAGAAARPCRAGTTGQRAHGRAAAQQCRTQTADRLSACRPRTS